jgi:hypothetical protein
VAVVDLSREPRATDLSVKRRPPAERDAIDAASAWVLLVVYRAGGEVHAARLPLNSGTLALRVDALLRAAAAGKRAAARELYACLHAEWGRQGLAGRHPAWDAVFRYLAPQAAGAAAGT